jgi:hypothetical protein
MTPRRIHPWPLLRVGFLVCVYGLGVIAILASGSRPPRSTYAPQTPSQPSCPPGIDETKPNSSVQLVAVTPSSPLPTERVVTIDRHYEEKSSWLVSSCHTSRKSRYIPKGNIVVVDREIQFGFGFSPLELTSYEGRELVTSTPLGLSLLVKNSSARGVNIDWNAVTLIDATGKAYGVIHRGVKMADRSGILAPSTIPPGAILEDFVYPKAA